MVKRICTLSMVVLLGVLALASPAQATEGHYPSDPWEVRDVTCSPYPDCVWVDAVESAINENAVTLSKPLGEVGTSIETTNLNLIVDTDTTMTVNLTVSSDDVFESGAVRMFYYDHPDADTILDGPTQSVLGEPGDDSLSLSIPAGTAIGTMGLTYDASNGSDGSVTFSNLIVGSTSILFTAPAACEWNESLLASDGECVKPTPESEPMPAPTPSASPVPEASEDTLPLTGASTLTLVGIGTGMFAAGLLSLVGPTVWRRYRVARNSGTG